MMDDVAVVFDLMITEGNCSTVLLLSIFPLYKYVKLPCDVLAFAQFLNVSGNFCAIIMLCTVLYSNSKHK